MNIDVSNLGDKITGDSLSAIFATYGNVSSADILKDTPGGAALIVMPDEKQAAKAIARLHGSIIDGKALVVKRSLLK
ncbi:MAG TPA: RNA-binding protein [Flavisolibacter sp.]|nr:RNA-binding protein [Flavisolibacter sp.]